MQRSVLSFIAILAFGVGAAIFLVKKGNDAADEIQRLNSGVFAVRRAAFARESDDKLGSGMVDTSNWKTYRNEKYGFEFKYPIAWNLTQDSTPDYGDLSISISNGEFGIDLDVSSDSGKKLGGGFCEDAGPHVEDCSDETTLSGIHYARIVQTGMLTEMTYRSRFLKVYMNTSKAFIQFSTTIVNEDGTAVQNVDRVIETFDKILSTFKFIK